MSFEKKKDKVIQALDAMFSDTSVSKVTCMEALEEIEAAVESKIDALQSDIDAEPEEGATR